MIIHVVYNTDRDHICRICPCHVEIYVCLGKIKLTCTQEYMRLLEKIDRFVYYISKNTQRKYLPLGMFDPGTPVSKTLYITNTLQYLLLRGVYK